MAYKERIERLATLKLTQPESLYEQNSYIADVLNRVEETFSKWDWQGLEAEGFHKKQDYAFIYSYPPVRTLDPIDQSELFQKSRFGGLNGPINLYVHIPYCTGICSYCYFAKVVDSDRAPILRSDYPEYIRRELSMILDQDGGSPFIQTVHFGGGTPSTLNRDELSHILETIRRCKMSEEAEITLECAPETLVADPDKVRMFIDSGINRFNLGVESLDDDVLKIMGRRHGADQTMRAMEILFEAGVNNLNVDVIYALPGQNLASWIDTLYRLESAGVHSISNYRLRQHPLKAISKLQADLYPSYEEGLKMQLAHGIVMDDAGFIRSSSHKYARGEKKLQRQVELKRGVGHNQLLSLGCGAYGFINDTFYWNTKSLNEYRDAISAGKLPIWIGKRLTPLDLQCKAMVQGMHTNAGVPIQGFANKFEVEPQDNFGAEIDRMVSLSLLEITDGHIRPTETGRFFADEISTNFYSGDVKARLSTVGMRYGMLFEADKYV
ncbi:coproporphyrinogen-III oxidase family protein (plasmid) [Rhizobium sp. CB3171]|uniref:coproporphyrinogen-III oxidase family protein n=1 Tax=Rhizobium sp. CB3171 TaxID=3039157 RepID=UPI0024B07101|nr:coproporphyrinogen-III oxidase family protein [Rhizobium sp. CB3171]WFU04542.1 coproporphyrinogen-III oxidase family protein [Rhizobium sp. CB3171]